MKNTSSTLLTAVSALSFALFASTATANDICRSYQFKVNAIAAAPAGTYGFTISRMNNNGSIVGWTSPYVPYYYNGNTGIIQTLPTPPTTYAPVVDINDREKMTGYLYNFSTTGPVFVFDGITQAITYLPSSTLFSDAQAITTNGIIAGNDIISIPVWPNQIYRAAKWTPRYNTPAISVAPVNSTHAVAVDSDDHGRVIGNNDFTYSYSNPSYSGAIFENGTTTRLAGYAPTQKTWAEKINSSGNIIIGRAEKPSPVNPSPSIVPVYWKRNAAGAYNIFDLTGSSANIINLLNALDVNNHGHILLGNYGPTIFQIYNTRAKTYRKIDISPVSSPGWVLNSVSAINDKCQVAANATDVSGKVHLVLLDPQ